MATARVFEQGLTSYTAITAQVIEQGVSTYTTITAQVLEQGVTATLITGATAQVFEQGVRSNIPHHMIMLSDNEWHPATLYRATADSWL